MLSAAWGAFLCFGRRAPSHGAKRRGKLRRFLCPDTAMASGAQFFHDIMQTQGWEACAKRRLDRWASDCAGIAMIRPIKREAEREPKRFLAFPRVAASKGGFMA